eukprot:CAMPEP_0180441286 /NCGR_PEP_ID=MMETSP1036_2-20121128/13546_1 /TAXON_ID=632150 /ORGANISM="Azadinium spinosum, Strain 3D9" /LENGTH=64 /DNA_ID=CAMNT_0022447493 /DNA_START=286 /DNA_END=480 /DNA_ORIENTATION=+
MLRDCDLALATNAATKDSVRRFPAMLMCRMCPSSTDPIKLQMYLTKQRYSRWGATEAPPSSLSV